MTCGCSIGFIKGERKVLTFTATNPKVSSFSINNAEYEVVDQLGVVISNGTCDVINKTITCIIEMDTEGYYTMTITYTVGRELLKAIFPIQVDV